jgi:Kef-type K+ transport system membrane component KefB
VTSFCLKGQPGSPDLELTESVFIRFLHPESSMAVFRAASHDDVLMLLVQIVVLLAAARGLSELVSRFKQPGVLGEILAGILLGPSFAAALFPQLHGIIVPAQAIQGYLLETISLLGALFLLLITGLEMDLALIRRHARTALGVSFGGIVVTFASGFTLGQLLPDAVLSETANRLITSLFLATAMSISAIPVLARVLMELKLMRRNLGQTMIAAGMSDDTIGWILLSIVIGLAGGNDLGSGDVVWIVSKVLLFIAFSFTIVSYVVRHALSYVQRHAIIPGALFTVIVLTMFALSAITQGLGLEPVLGAFVAGIVISRSGSISKHAHETLQVVSLSIFSPIFFAVAGLKVNLAFLLDAGMALLAVIVIAIATAGKILGTYLGARLIGRQNHLTALSFGAGLNARGAMEILIATIGLSLGILSQEMFSIIVIMAIVTSLMAPPMLRWVVQHIPPDADEERRLKQEAILADSPIRSLNRVLLPVRIDPEGASSRIIEAGILNLLGSTNRLQVELLNIPQKASEKQQGLDYLKKIRPLFHVDKVIVRAIPGKDPASIILDEVKAGYDLLVLGAPRNNDLRNEGLFNPIIDTIVRQTPCPTLVVSKGKVNWQWSPRRILVPVNGSAPSRNAAQLAFQIANRDTVVIIFNVIEDQRSGLSGIFANPFHIARIEQIQRDIVEEIAAMGEIFGARTEHEVSFARSYDREVLRYTQTNQIDLILLGTSVRSGPTQLFLGSRVENIVLKAECPVAILNVNES